VGQGHGLFHHLAASAPECSTAEGWDISPSSIAAMRSALQRMGDTNKITLRLSDLFAPHDRTFQSVVFSEVLEHVEEPAAALDVLGSLLSPGGRLFINVPINSPSPDHIYLFRNPEEVVQMMEGLGFRIVQTHFLPCTGATLEKARRLALTISCVVVATR
jgi:2-polyprenyl-3-methyl-5-hydroxy-6-metoxy-1,4-benzoquinol methylase